MQERSDLLLQIKELTEEREDLLRKALSLKQSLKTLKSELTQRDNVAESLKRQNRELRQTLNLL